MVDTKRYDPTITRFQKHTKSFVSGKTKKGHLNNGEREAGDVIKEEGILVKVNGKDLQGKSWYVQVGKKYYWCTYGDNIVYLPECTKNGDFYIPKKKCKVEISIDKKSKIYTITRINDDTKQPIAMVDNEISLSGNVSVSGDVKVDTKDDKDLPDSISMTELYKKVQIIEEKLSDNNDI